MNKDLTTGKPEKVLWQFCLPLFGSIIFQQLYNIADSFVAGKLPARFLRHCFLAQSSIRISKLRSIRRSFPAA